jgi:hypothetical protein
MLLMVASSSDNPRTHPQVSVQYTVQPVDSFGIRLRMSWPGSSTGKYKTYHVASSWMCTSRLSQTDSNLCGGTSHSMKIIANAHRLKGRCSPSREGSPHWIEINISVKPKGNRPKESNLERSVPGSGAPNGDCTRRFVGAPAIAGTNSSSSCTWEGSGIVFTGVGDSSRHALSENVRINGTTEKI